MKDSIHHIGRRGFLKGAGALASVAGSLEALQAAQKPGSRPKNIIFMVADGMSPSVLPLAEHFSQRVRGKGLLWRALIDRPEAARGWMDMASLNSVVTDSSAASSSWGSGSRIFNGWLNTLPDGTKLTPIASVAQQQRKRVGLVTTTTITHATPAGFAAVQNSRGNEDEIAVQYLGLVDVLLGGGRQFFEAATRKDRSDLAAKFRQAGYRYVSMRRELLALQSKPPAQLLGLFAQGMIPYSIDRNNQTELSETVPTLAEMTAVALGALASAPNGFLLQVEGGRVDHAAHSNDAAALLWDQLAFDEAIETVLQFAARHPETLVVITADHGNSNPAIGGKWAEYHHADNGFAVLARAKCSFSELIPKFGKKDKPASAETIRELTQEAFGFALTAQEAEAVRAAVMGAKNLCLNTRLDKTVGILGQAAGNHTGIGWMSTDHTSDYVVLTALGPGSERFAGQIRNTKCFELMAEYMGSSFRNPAMTADQARKYLRAAAMPVDQPHWA